LVALQAIIFAVREVSVAFVVVVALIFIAIFVFA
jgi:hypothetical protein